MKSFGCNFFMACSWSERQCLGMHYLISQKWTPKAQFMLSLGEFWVTISFPSNVFKNVNLNYKQLMATVYYFLLNLPTMWFHSTNEVIEGNLGAKYLSLSLKHDWPGLIHYSFNTWSMIFHFYMFCIIFGKTHIHVIIEKNIIDLCPMSHLRNLEKLNIIEL